ncbi:cytochrome P450 monooxygenase [Fusarium pseudocircinatum]|uniref:Cytochrome P450 monooxygenase n=1 Tax=Fusarium pseudocircinatum TaxID=56676 RepID=A0A8H5KMQ5_9HYPO|nr:cytochrome P450 monooxygenase [Fusarium pseudocircinatum]
MTATYGHQVADWDDPYIRKIYEVLVHLTLMSEPGSWLLDAFPLIARLPSVLVQNWWNISRKWFEKDRKVYLKFYRNLVQQIKEGTAPHCFPKELYEGGLEKGGISEEQAVYAAGTLIEAGSGSTSTVVNAWILNCQLNPHVVTAEQEELGRVAGSDRMPSYDD